MKGESYVIGPGGTTISPGTAPFQDTALEILSAQGWLEPDDTK
jgi:hypothetical protein